MLAAACLLPGICPGLAVAEESQAADERCALAIKLVDADSGASLPGMIRIRDSAGRGVAIGELLNRGQGVEDEGPIHQWWVLAEPRTIAVPRETLVVEALAGLDTERTERTLDLAGREKAELEIPLVRFGADHRRHFRAGNTHLHLRKLSKTQAERDLREVPRSDGLDVVFVSYLERAGDDLQYTSNHYTPDDLRRLSDDHVQFGYGEEHRHNFGSYGEGYGHVLLLDIPRVVQPVSIGTGIAKRGPDAPPLRAGIDEARRLGGKAVWAHNRLGFENIPNWVTGHLQANNMRDGNDHGNYADPYYRYLNIGRHVPLAAGTDWFIYDFSCAYVLAKRALTPREWLDRLAAGRSTITNGPLLEFAVDDRELGSVLDLAGPREVAVRGRAVGRNDFARSSWSKTATSSASPPAAGRGATSSPSCKSACLSTSRAGWPCARRTSRPRAATTRAATRRMSSAPGCSPTRAPFTSSWPAETSSIAPRRGA